MIYDAIYTLLAADGTITAALSTYLGQPAIISSPIELTDLDCPYILIEQVAGGNPAKGEPRCLRGGTETVYVRVVDDREQSSETLTAISNAIFSALDREKVSNSYCAGWLTCSRPSLYIDGDGFPGALVVVTADLWG
jgi:hypothetical protein